MKTYLQNLSNLQKISQLCFKHNRINFAQFHGVVTAPLSNLLLLLFPPATVAVSTCCCCCCHLLLLLLPPATVVVVICYSFHFLPKDFPCHNHWCNSSVIVYFHTLEALEIYSRMNPLEFPENLRRYSFS